MRKKQKQQVTKILAIIVIFILAAITTYFLDIYNKEEVIENNALKESEKGNTSIVENTVEDKLQIHYMDVGQADCIIIKQGTHAMIIDAGKNESEDRVVNYIKELGIEKFDYIIGTHVHEDHIGGIDKVIENFDTDNIFFPKQTSTTKTFENFVKAVKAENKKLYAPKPGEKFELGEATFEVFAPNSLEYEDANNYSIVIKLTYRNKSFLFMGDAEEISEKEILNKGFDLKCDVLKLGHHGSRSSTSDDFLKEVAPSAAIISCGKNNSYKHPSKQTMLKLQASNIPVYRTDESGTIILNTDGEYISFNVKEGTYNYGK